MLTIRQNQFDDFREAARQRFEKRMVEVLRESFPRSARKLEESGLRDVIQHGIKTARGYGVVRQCDVGRYIALMFMFGPNFDKKVSSGPLYTILRNPRFKSSAGRTNALCMAAVLALRARRLRTRKRPSW
jgi:hypothetical protein